MTSTSSVCAIVVTFRPDTTDLDNLSLILAQAQALVVVDNGSPPDTLNKLRSLSTTLGFHFFENGENLGIAAALNRGLTWAEQQKYKWVLLLDQDSSVTEGFTRAMLTAFQEHPLREKIGIMAPVYVDKRSGTVLPAAYAGDGQLQYAMTSGNLMPLSIFRKIGPFESSLFIGGVDFEYCLRLRSLSYRVEECKCATLLHAPAAPSKHCIAGRWSFATSNYSAGRWYYRSRNIVWMMRKYGRQFPYFFIELCRINFREWIKVLLAEKNKVKKSGHILLGLYDGLVGRTGRGAQL